jgi:hypothetical protein
MAVVPTIAVSNTVYTPPVAKVMISIPDKLLEQVDDHVRSTRQTRSGFLQRLAERELAASKVDRRIEIERLLDSLNLDIPGGDAARLIREDRESH